MIAVHRRVVSPPAALVGRGARGARAAARVRGIQGVIIDGAATDVQAVRAMQFPVFCRTVSALTTKALHLTGEVNAPIRCGGVSVAPGDLILADENGVVVVSPGEG